MIWSEYTGFVRLKYDRVIPTYVVVSAYNVVENIQHAWLLFKCGRSVLDLSTWSAVRAHSQNTTIIIIQVVGGEGGAPTDRVTASSCASGGIKYHSASIIRR